MWARLRKLYFLHTSAYTTPVEGEEVCRYLIHYDGRATETFVVKNHHDIADWHKAKSHPNARAVWYSENGEAVFLSEWNNPHPDRRIRTLDVIASRSGYVALLGITGVLTKTAPR